MTKVNIGHAVKMTYTYSKKTVQKGVTGAGAVFESTEASKKFWQVLKGVVELTGIFTPVTALRPVIQATKVISITVGGFDWVGRVKEFIVPDKDGETLLDKPWTKIISRVHLAFANYLDFIIMLKFFDFFTITRLSKIATFVTKVHFLKVFFDNVPALETIKLPFVIFASAWSILHSAESIYWKVKDKKYYERKERKWDKLSTRNYDRQIEYFEARKVKYEARINALAAKQTVQKLSKYEQHKLNRAISSLPQYAKLVKAMNDDTGTDHADDVRRFADQKADKWHVKVTNINIDFAKIGVSIPCEVLKIFFLATALILGLSVVGWTFLPAMLVVLGILSNGSSLVKFLVDKLVTGNSVPKVKMPKFAR